MLDRDLGLLDMLARWLPQQRWFPGRGMALSELAIVSDVLLQAGDPAMRHLIVQTPLGPGTMARFQVLVGYRKALPSELRGALIGHQEGVACYDALHDPELADVLLAGMSEQRLAGPLRFVREPAAPVLAGRVPDGRVLGAEQSNTSLVFGDQAILKVLRRLFPGANPDLEVADALARLGSPRVAAPYGWIETDLDGEPVLLGVLSRFLAGASDGWTLALDHLRRLYTRHGAYGQEYLTEPVAADGDLARAAPFAGEARQLGLATAELHADLARAFGRRDMAAAELSALAADMHGKLSAAIAVVPDLAGHEERIRSAYDAVARLAGPVSVQRIHGDYHLGQVLLGPQGWVALDFEGEPAVPLAVRRAPAPALRDVAGMLRSFDYAARQQLVGHPDAGPLAPIAQAWAQQCQAAFRAGYAAGGGIDPAGHDTLLRALTLEKAVYEVVYEHRHRPAWLSIPLDFVAAA
ncbi:MAG TPA: aminoglycoside phosphotransferase [Streptosporangiaceae bacterium]|nr:aminoglycoside phosphotransferase [Streptosporangiaceae bacterium]